jgi:NADPH-dependent curcumin reductase CurA
VAKRERTDPSSVGSFAVQIAKHICGARRVIGIAGPRKTEFVLSLGADAVVDYTAPDFPQRLLEAVGPDLADRHLESVGGAVFNAAIAAVKPHGVIGFCGMLSTYNEKKKKKKKKWLHVPCCTLR